MSSPPINSVPTAGSQDYLYGANAALGPNAASPLGMSTADFSYMTPDALMTYCETRLQGIDTQVKTQFAKQQQANKESTALTNLMQALSAGNGGDIHGGDTTSNGIQDAFKKALDASAGDPATFNAVKAEYAKYRGTALVPDVSGYDVAPSDTSDKDNLVTDKELQGMSANIKDAQANLNSGTELAMINLQQLMSQRQTAVSTCTNLISTLDQAPTAIAQNLKV
jgi:hypothetical protein